MSEKCVWWGRGGEGYTPNPKLLLKLHTHTHTHTRALYTQTDALMDWELDTAGSTVLGNRRRSCGHMVPRPGCTCCLLVTPQLYDCPAGQPRFLNNE